MDILDVARDVAGAGLASPLAILGLAMLGIGGIAYLALRGQMRIAALVVLIAGIGAAGWFGWQAWPAAVARRAQITQAANEALVRSPEIARALEEKVAEIETGRVRAFVQSRPEGVEIVSADPATGRVVLRVKQEVRCKGGGEAKRAMLRIAAPDGFALAEAPRLNWLGGERNSVLGNVHGGVGPIIYRGGDPLGGVAEGARVAEAEIHCQSVDTIAFGPGAWTSWEMIGTIEAKVSAEERARLLREVVARVDPALRARALAQAEASAGTLAEWISSRRTP